MPLKRPPRRPSTPVPATAPAVVPGLPRLGSAEFLADVHALVGRMAGARSADAAVALDDLRRAYLGLAPATDLAGVDPAHPVLRVFDDAVGIRARRRPAWFLTKHEPR